MLLMLYSAYRYRLNSDLTDLLVSAVIAVFAPIAYRWTQWSLTQIQKIVVYDATTQTEVDSDSDSDFDSKSILVEQV